MTQTALLNEVRKFLAKNPNAKPKDVIEGLAKKGVTVTPSIISKVKPAIPKIQSEITNAYVPMIINGTSIPESKSQKLEMTISQFLDDFIVPDLIDCTPPYQRDSCWKKSQQKAFIATCCNKSVPIPPFYICKKFKRTNSTKRVAVDCRQRVTAIKDFVEGRIKINVTLELADGTTKTKTLTWSQMKDNPQYAHIVETFKTQTIVLVDIDFMDYDSQRKLFVALNNGEPLNKYERIYCEFFLSRKFLAGVFDDVLGNASVHMTNKVKNQVRFAHINAIHEALVLAHGVKFDQPPPLGVCHVGNKITGRQQVRTKGRGVGREPGTQTSRQRQQSARHIHETLRENGIDWDAADNPGVVKMLGIHESSQMMRSIAAVFHTVFEANPKLLELSNPYTNTAGGTIHSRNLIDPLVFFYGKIYEEEMTLEDLEPTKLDRFLKRYFEAKTNQAAAYSMTTTDTKTMTAKFDLMETICNQKIVGF